MHYYYYYYLGSCFFFFWAMECTTTMPSPAMAFQFPTEAGVAMAGSSRTPNAAMGWPLGLRSCMVASPLETAATMPISAQTWLQARLEEGEAAAAQHSLGFRFPYFSDPSATSESDSDFHSETVSSSFFKDSRRITLGSLIGLPMDSSGRAAAAAGIHLDQTHYHRRRWSFSFAIAKSCGLREALLGCANCLQSDLEETLSEILMDHPEPIGLSQSLAACLELERRNAALEVGPGAAAEDPRAANRSSSRRSPEWSASQFVSCDSMLSDDAEEEDDSVTDNEKGYASDQAAATTPFPGSGGTLDSASRNSNAMTMSGGVQRSLSMKSFLSTICCHIHPHRQQQQP